MRQLFESLPRSSRLMALVLSVVVTAVPVVAQQAEAPRVVVALATPVELPHTVEALGTARANESIEVRPMTSEVVSAIRFEEGQLVQAGAVLIELEDDEAQARLAAARAALADTDSQQKRGEELLRAQLIPESQLATLAAKREADQASLLAAKARLADSVVRAPFAGRVGLRRVSLGALVSRDTVITTLDDLDPIKVDFDVPETALGRLAEDLAIVAGSAAWPDQQFHGKVASIDTRVDPVSRTIRVRGQIPNPEGRLRPGMFLTVRLLSGQVSALLIPEQAIVPKQSRQFVLVVGDGDVVAEREVTIGRRRPGQVEVTAGLSAGERVVAEGVQKVRPGSPVTIAGQIEVVP